MVCSPTANIRSIVKYLGLIKSFLSYFQQVKSVSISSSLHLSEQVAFTSSMLLTSKLVCYSVESTNSGLEGAKVLFVSTCKSQLMENRRVSNFTCWWKHDLTEGFHRCNKRPPNTVLWLSHICLTVAENINVSVGYLSALPENPAPLGIHSIRKICIIKRI